jgi:sugar phosphate isomerase/epimerase
VRIGVDSYSYHRLLGERRRGEPAAQTRLPSGFAAVLHEIREAGAEAAALQTCFLPPPRELDVLELTREAAPLELALSWGAPEGIAFGAAPGALADLLAWLELAPRLGVRLVRVVAGGPRLRGAAPVEEQLAGSVEPLALAASAARARGVALALENHGDLKAGELADVVARVGDSALGVCFDTANALRVGDDVLEAVALVAPLVRMVHLKDCDGPGAGTAGPRSVGFGEGVVPLSGVLETLAAAGFAGPVFVELGQLGDDDERELVRSSVSWLRRALPAGSGLQAAVGAV